MSELPRHICFTPFESLPLKEQTYAFSGQVFPERIEDRALCTEIRVYPGMKYIGDEGEFHIFKLQVDHPGHEHFKGCSGAPIVDMNKNVVALVCNGDIETNIIRDVSIARYKSLFDSMFYKST